MKIKERIKLQEKATGFLFPVVLFILIMLIGLGMNWKVIKNNNYKMPVLYENNFESKTHITYTDESEINYPFLSDRIRFIGGTWSLGDFVLAIGFAGSIWIFILMLRFLFKLSKINKKSQIELKGGKRI